MNVPTKPMTAGRMRWWIVGLLFVITVINYVDRQSLSLLAPDIQRYLRIDDRVYGHVVTSFLLAYTVAYIFAGRVCDWLGTRRSMALFVGWWSFAEMLPPFARSGLSLGMGRFMLGLGEAGNYVVIPKAVRQWFPAEERALAIGICTSGATIGATLAPLIIATVASSSGWQAVFFATGIAGLVWIVPWLWIHHSNRAGAPESSADLSLEVPSSDERAGVWSSVLHNRTTWILMTARFLTDPVWYFYLFWYPKYLFQYRHLTLTQVAHKAWPVYLAADIGTLVGGLASGILVRKGLIPLSARRWVMLISACIFPLSPLAALLHNTNSAILIASCIAFAHMAWLVSLTALIVDLFPSSQVATAAGVIAGGSGLGGMVSTEVISFVIARSSFTPIFLAMAVLHPLAFLVVSRIRRDPAKRPRTSGRLLASRG